MALRSENDFAHITLPTRMCTPSCHSAHCTRRIAQAVQEIQLAFGRLIPCCHGLPQPVHCFAAIRFHRGAIQGWACQKNPCQCFLGLWLAIPGCLAQQREHGGVVTRSLGLQGQLKPLLGSRGHVQRQRCRLRQRAGQGRCDEQAMPCMPGQRGNWGGNWCGNWAEFESHFCLHLN